MCPLSALETMLHQSGARSMIAFGGLDASINRPAQIDQNYLALRFNDISGPRSGLQEPTQDHIEQIISVADKWDRKAPILLQCWMGISRSTAAAAIILARIRPDLSADKIAQTIRHASPCATPNSLMIAHADRLLNPGGGLSAAIASIGRGEMVSEGTAFSISLDGI